MEENEKVESQESEEQKEPRQETPFGQSGSGVSFPTVGQPQKSGGPKTILIIGILILVAVLGFVVYKSATGKGDATPEPTSFDNQIEGSQTSVETSQTSQPTSSPKPIDRSAVSIVIQNGTGITGEAAYLQTQLKNMGYSDISVGNASTQDATATSVTFSKSLSADVVTEITQKLNTIYQKVTTITGTSGTSDVLIVTGLRKGATAKPSASPTPKASASPSASSSASPTPTTTP
jgi:hypothetical protein